MHSVFYFNSTLSNNNIATLAAVASDLYIQPECQCPPSHSIVLERECQDLSGTNRISRINSAAHDATYINDGNTSTWWQSSNGETPVNVTVGLGGLRAALTVVMHFKSLLPYAMVLYYSSNGELFSPRKFYAVNCSMFSFLSNGSLSIWAHTAATKARKFTKLISLCYNFVPPSLRFVSLMHTADPTPIDISLTPLCRSDAFSVLL